MDDKVVICPSCIGYSVLDEEEYETIPQKKDHAESDYCYLCFRRLGMIKATGSVEYLVPKSDLPEGTKEGR